MKILTALYFFLRTRCLTEPTIFPHHIVASSMFNGRIGISVNYSRFAVPRHEARALLRAVVVHMAGAGADTCVRIT